MTSQTLFGVSACSTSPDIVSVVAQQPAVFGTNRSNLPPIELAHSTVAEGQVFTFTTATFPASVRVCGWSKNVLIHQIDNQTYEKSLLGQTNFDRVLTRAQRAQAKLAVKDEYTFDFLELSERHSERELERALIARIEDFLRAMGGEFEPEFVGKMQFYLTALDRLAREQGEAEPIGIILCKEKSRTIVEYALHDTRKPIGVATYRIVKRLPKELKGQLPSPEEIARLLEDVR